MNSNNKRRVVITGLGTVNPTGSTVAESWAAVKAGRCAVGPITAFDTADFKVKLAAEVKDFDPNTRLDRREARKMARFTQFAVAAAIEAIQDSGLVLENIDRTRFGVILSSGIGGQAITEAEHCRGLEKGFDRVSPFYVPTAICNMAAGQVAIDAGFRAMCSCPVTACAGGTNAVGDALRQVRDGYADVVLCGGAEAVVNELAMGGFTSMHALSTAEEPDRASIPFDAARSGFVMGEGAGILVLEELKHARRRRAPILAEVVGYGATCDAHHITAPALGGAGAARCMTMALADAGVEPEQVDYINAHGTSTPMNDVCETQAVKTAFGAHARRLMMSSTKSMTGHMLGAAGAVEAIFTALSLKEDFAPATIGYREPDPECDLDIVPNEGRKALLCYAMSNSLGFGGHNASILLKKWEA